MKKAGFIVGMMLGSVGTAMLLENAKFNKILDKFKK